MTDTDFGILSALPHRPPFRFLSHVEQLDPGSSGEAVWNVTGTEAFLQGHFPGEPIVPGVLIGEALAQLSGLVGFSQDMSRDEASQRQPPVAPQPGRLAHVELRFDEPVRPPACIRLRSRQTTALGALRLFNVEAHVEDRRVARGRLTLATVKGPREEPT